MTQLSKQILCTLGPASMKEAVIKRMEQLGVSLFRINMSHTKIADLPSVIGFIQNCTSVSICIDTEGAQIRTGDLIDGHLDVRENTVFQIYKRRVPGNRDGINFYPPDIIDDLKEGDFISIDFNAVLVQAIARTNNDVTLRVVNGGRIGQNKAITVEREIHLPPLTDKDRAAIPVAKAAGIKHFALSFANCAEDVATIRCLAGEDAFLISKIESRRAIANLEEIALASQAILIDRGDLSRELSIEQIPPAQKAIIRTGKALARQVYVATNFLESMVTLPLPTRAEVNDIHNTMLDGADGLVLAAETAIGSYPVELIVKMIQGFERNGNREDGTYHEDPVSLLASPHGGVLVHRVSDPDNLPDLNNLHTLTVSETVLMDCEQIAHGTYSPLTGFMGSEALQSVLETNRLPDGTVWTMPILLQLPSKAAADFGAGDRIVLKSASGVAIALMDVSEIFAPDLADLTRKWFGTDSSDHPGAARDTKGLYARSRRGEIDNLIGVSPSIPYEPPIDPDLRIDTAACDEASAQQKLLDFVLTRLSDCSPAAQSS